MTDPPIVVAVDRPRGRASDAREAEGRRKAVARGPGSVGEGSA